MASNSFYIIINGTAGECCWYHNKQGHTLKVSNDLFPPSYNWLNKSQIKKGIYPLISHTHATIVKVSRFKKLLFKLGLLNRYNSPPQQQERYKKLQKLV